ncbi:MAG: substrate-binding domain-containing protein [Thermodesulfobacteriota bacterium]|nr:substrate-binding domain-containing protein [Thermodesulfobacteriota bacterium]
MDKLLTTKELAEFLRLNEKKIYQLVKDGNIPHVRIAGKWLFPERHVMRWIDESVQRERDILIVGSNDVLMERLVLLYSQENFPGSVAFYSSMGSSRGVHALSLKKGQVCCTHLLDMETGEYNLPFLDRVLSGQRYVVVNLWRRKQGLIVKKDNPMGLRGLEDVIEKGAKLINRNEGSGTRVLLEYFLREKDLNEKDIIGFNKEVDSHLDVALKVFFGEADVGLGIEYVTYPLGLDFLPLKEEMFDLVIPVDLWSTSVIKGFMNYVDPARIDNLSRNLPGYNLKDTGKIRFEN